MLFLLNLYMPLLFVLFFSCSKIQYGEKLMQNNNEQKYIQLDHLLAIELHKKINNYNKNIISYNYNNNNIFKKNINVYILHGWHDEKDINPFMNIKKEFLKFFENLNEMNYLNIYVPKRDSINNNIQKQVNETKKFINKTKNQKKSFNICIGYSLGGIIGYMLHKEFDYIVTIGSPLKGSILFKYIKKINLKIFLPIIKSIFPKFEKTKLNGIQGIESNSKFIIDLSQKIKEYLKNKRALAVAGYYDTKIKNNLNIKIPEINTNIFGMNINFGFINNCCANINKYSNIAANTIDSYASPLYISDSDLVVSVDSALFEKHKNLTNLNVVNLYNKNGCKFLNNHSDLKKNIKMFKFIFSKINTELKICNFNA